MFGWINDCTEKLVISKFGIEKWHIIKEKAGCDVEDGGFIRHEIYPDDSTVQLVVAAAETLGLTVDQVLEAFGVYFMEFVRKQGYENLLACQGNTLRSWLSNMNALHDHLESSLPRGMIKPVFWCEDDDETDGVMILHYYSKRGNLLVPVVIGVVKEVSRYHFDVDIEMELLRKQDVEGATHTSWRILAKEPEESWKITVKESNMGTANMSEVFQNPIQCPFTGMMCNNSQSSLPSPIDNLETDDSTASNREGKCPLHQHDVHHRKVRQEPCISGRKMKTIFPYHVVVDESFEIIQVGSSFPHLMNQSDEDYFTGKNLKDILCISKPVMGIWDWKTLKKLEDQTFFVDPVDYDLHHVKFKGNIVRISDPGEAFQVMLVLSPDVKNVMELRCMQLTMSDLPLHSFQRDAVLLGEHIVSEVQSAHNLQKLSTRLKYEKKLSNALLHALIPPHVADELRAGKTVQPELHDEVTLFFSDIVGFTSICESIFPWDCVDLLNRLYCVMDSIATKFGLYKVETVGDAYICCSGLPHDDPLHAQRVANFAIAVMHCSTLVLNPMNGLPIQMRMGIHTGPVMSGVVGMTTPRYCIFGDTVNTTARHESTGVAGKIQCSSATYGKLQHFSDTQEFLFTPRGLVEMKGKGLMATYFLDGGSNLNDQVSPEALDRIYNELEVILATRHFSNKKYFKRYGRRASETFFGTTSTVQSDYSGSQESLSDFHVTPASDDPACDDSCSAVDNDSD